MNSNEKKLKKIFSDIFKIEENTVDENSSVDNIESWDSLNHLNLILALELEFGISFSEEQTVEILNYSLVKLVLQEHGVSFENG